jgi:predicted transcriptional regulator
MKHGDSYLTKREQQIMELAFQNGEVTTQQAMRELPGSPANSTVRTLLKILEEKGHLKHEEVGGRYVYRPVRARHSAAHTAIRRLTHTFFEGSVSRLMMSLLSDPEVELSEDEAGRLEELIRKAKADNQ